MNNNPGQAVQGVSAVVPLAGNFKRGSGGNPDQQQGRNRTGSQKRKRSLGQPASAEDLAGDPLQGLGCWAFMEKPAPGSSE